ncbi:MAG: dTMP kinase [Candidatus Aminicenantes bacterium]|nr:dTMP kinase [Candidatus Aminicenantes bacterium]
MREKRGLLIVIEGIDGSGKTTQARFLARKLKKLGLSVITLREPTRSRWGRKIRAMARSKISLDPQEELELFLRDREDNVKRHILPALNQKKIVILDRYYFSTMAYQGARGIDPLYIRKINEAFAPKPDAVFILHLSASEGLSRISHRRKKDILFEQERYLEKVAEIFQSLKGRNFYHLDATQSKPQIGELIFNRVIALLKKKKLLS